MKKVFTLGNQKLLRGYSAILVLISAIIVGGHLYGFIAGDMMEGWFLSFITGVLFLITGSIYAFGWHKPPDPEIHIDSEKMEWKRPGWSSSFSWSKLARVDLNGKKLQATYAQTGLSDSIRIPILTNAETMKNLKSSLREACEEHEIPFDHK